MIKMINYMFWAEQVGVDPPPPPKGESPIGYSRLDMNPDDVSTTTNYKISYEIFWYENDFVHKYT